MNVNIKRVKIFVTVPIEDLDKVRKAMFEKGAGEIGTNYTECSFSSKGIGTFKPNDNANPYIGEKDKFETVEEEKLEVICDVDRVNAVLSALREEHPYEEPAIDIIPLLDEDSFKIKTRII
jgi:hypothetical protein